MNDKKRNENYYPASPTAQVTPLEFCTKVHAAAEANGATTVAGEVTGVQLAPDPDDTDGGDRVTGVEVTGANGEINTIPCDVCVIAMVRRCRLTLA